MSGLRETLDDLESSVDAPTLFRTERNSHELRCAGCGELFFVDAHTYDSALSALEWDATANTFFCDDCEAEYAEESAR